MASITIPEELYAKIVAYAAQHGQDVNAVAADWLEKGAETDEEDLLELAPDDPLMLLAGIISSGQPGYGDEHDAYFGSEEHHADKE